MNPILDFLVQASASLAGAFAGALSAFGLERWKATRAEHEKRAAALRIAMFTLMAERVFFINVKNQFLDEKRDAPNRSIELKAISTTPPNVALHIGALGFMLDESDGEVLNRMMNADLRFRGLVSLIAKRNDLHLRFQERLEAMQREMGGAETFEWEDVKRGVGPMMLAQLRDLTEAIFEHTDDGLRASREVDAVVRQYAARKFKKERFFRIEELPTTDANAATPPQYRR